MLHALPLAQSALVMHSGTVVVVVEVVGSVVEVSHVRRHVAGADSTHALSQDVSHQYGSRWQTSVAHPVHWAESATPSTHSSCEHPSQCSAQRLPASATQESSQRLRQQELRTLQTCAAQVSNAGSSASPARQGSWAPQGR